MLNVILFDLMLKLQDLVDKGAFLVSLFELMARLLDLIDYFGRLFKLQS